MKHLLLIVFLIFSIKISSQNVQNLTVHYTNNKTTQHTGKLIYNYDGFIDSFLIVNKKAKTKQSLNNVKSISTESGEKYIIKKYNENLYAFQPIIIGDLSLYKNKNNYYFENAEIGFKQISYKQRGDYKFNVFNAGEITVFVNKCKNLQNYLHENFNSITVKKLKTVVTKFNSCKVDSDIQISDQAIEKANLSNEVVTYGVSIGNWFFNSNFSGVSVDIEKKTSAPSFGAIIYFRPHVLDKKIMYNFSIDYISKSKTKFKTEDYYVTVQQSYLTTQLGINYLFLNETSKLSPYIGVTGGFYFNLDTGIWLNNTTIGLPSEFFGGDTELIYNLNAGCLIKVLNQDIDINVSYLPKSKFTLKSQALDQNYAHYHLNGVNIKLSYIF